MLSRAYYNSNISKSLSDLDNVQLHHPLLKSKLMTWSCWLLLPFSWVSQKLKKCRLSKQCLVSFDISQMFGAGCIQHEDVFLWCWWWMCCSECVGSPQSNSPANIRIWLLGESETKWSLWPNFGKCVTPSCSRQQPPTCSAHLPTSRRSGERDLDFEKAFSRQRSWILYSQK